MVEITEITIDIDAMFTPSSANGVNTPVLGPAHRGKKKEISFEEQLDFLLLTSKLTVREVSNITSPRVPEARISKLVQTAITKVADEHKLPRQEIKYAYDVTQQDHGVSLRRAAETSMNGIYRDAMAAAPGRADAEGGDDEEVDGEGSE
ncbi:hypothetical protein CBER1_00575 [Cercospora berteroae]|uniref:Uncharacterized protein n=1 Tax=Cercospora berteroae TaxID=357750 RepID=A0A2S6CBC5_9PEZI|nr:hypothetical protein CBER1_00575 [Cercospora berteroae]